MVTVSCLYMFVRFPLTLSTRQASADDRAQNLTNVKCCKKKIKIVEFHDHIWNHGEKYIQISTNMPGIGSVNREIVVEMSEMSESKQDFAHE